MNDEEKIITSERQAERLLREAKAVLFDFSGVIADNERGNWWPSIRDTLAEYGVIVEEKDRGQFQGVKLGKYLVDTFRLEVYPDIIYAQVIEKLEASYRRPDGVRSIEGAVELIMDLNKKGKHLAVCSSDRTDSVKEWLGRWGLIDCFEVIIGKENTEGNSKPAPDIYLQAAKELGVEPAKCVVVEDAESGVSAGKAAGMKVIAVPNPFRITGAFATADVAIKSLTNIDLFLIEKR